MGKYSELLKITQEEINEIKENSPFSLPLNPTSQGYSAMQVRRKLYMAICGEQGSVLSVLIDRLFKLGEFLDLIDPVANVELDKLILLLNKKVIGFDKNNEVVVYNLENFEANVINPLVSKEYVDIKIEDKANKFINKQGQKIDLEDVYNKTLEIEDKTKNVITLKTVENFPQNMKVGDYVFKTIKEAK